MEIGHAKDALEEVMELLQVQLLALRVPLEPSTIKKATPHAGLVLPEDSALPQVQRNVNSAP